MKRVLTLLLLTALGLEGAVEFSGFIVTSQETRFSLTDTETKDTSSWLRIGQSFGDYLVVSFDRKSEVLTVKKAGELSALPLRTAKVRDGSFTMSATITLQNDTRVKEVRASISVGEETVLPLEDGFTLHIHPEKQPDGKILYKMRYSNKASDGTENSISAGSIAFLPGQAFAIRLGDEIFHIKP